MKFSNPLLGQSIIVLLSWLGYCQRISKWILMLLMLVKLYWKVSIVFCPGATNTRQSDSQIAAPRTGTIWLPSDKLNICIYRESIHINKIHTCYNMIWYPTSSKTRPSPSIPIFVKAVVMTDISSVSCQWVSPHIIGQGLMSVWRQT